MQLKAYQCSGCEFEFVVVCLNKSQFEITNPYCPECGSDDNTHVINCLDFSLSEKLQAYQIEKSLKPIPGLVPKAVTRQLPPELDGALKLVEPQWHTAFLHFIQTGDASTAFMSLIGQDPKLQKAVEMAFDFQSKGIANLAKALSKK